MALNKHRTTAGVAGDYYVLEIADSTTLYIGSLAAANASGKAVPASKTTGITVLGCVFAVEDGKATIERGAFLWDNDSTGPVTAALIGKDCYVVDDCTVTATATGSVAAGKVLGFEGDQIIVETR